jgi:hypothetical protein
MKNLVSRLSFLAPVSLLASCQLQTKLAVPDKSVGGAGVLCHFSAKSTTQESAIPNRAYVFPPLRADIHGKPSEKLVPVLDEEGNVRDWSPPSPESRALRELAIRSLKSKGYEMVEFKDVLGMSHAHTVLMVSLFYHTPSTDEKAGKDGRRALLTMIRARTFDTDLDPSRCRAVSDVDGNTRIAPEDEPSVLTQKSFGTLVGWIGDNVSGYVELP